MAITLLPDTEETRKKLNTLAREQAKKRILNDILIDLAVCEIEGWNKKEYINDLKNFINLLGDENGSNSSK